MLSYSSSVFLILSSSSSSFLRNKNQALWLVQIEDKVLRSYTSEDFSCIIPEKRKVQNGR
ncbi:MAG TPA: hypothetical protein DDY67_02410 [Streptococcus salivarius]|nr:hypothetical protein [Streptococcus salivarius]